MSHIILLLELFSLTWSSWTADTCAVATLVVYLSSCAPSADKPSCRSAACTEHRRGWNERVGTRQTLTTPMRRHPPARSSPTLVLLTISVVKGDINVEFHLPIWILWSVFLIKMGIVVGIPLLSYGFTATLFCSILVNTL